MMTYNHSRGVHTTGRHSLSEGDAPYSAPLDLRFFEAASPPEVPPFPENPHPLLQFSERAGQNSTQSSSPWNGQANYFSSQDLGTSPALDRVQYLPPDSSPSQPWLSSPSSVRNSPFETNALYDPSTPRDTGLLSPMTDFDLAYPGENHPAHSSFAGLDCSSRAQDEPTEIPYIYQTYPDTELGCPFDLNMHGGGYCDPVPTALNTIMDDSGVDSPVSEVTSTMANVPNDYTVKEEEDIPSQYRSVQRRSGRKGTTSTRRGSGVNRVEKPRGDRGHPNRLQKHLPTRANANLSCGQCDASFKDEGALDKHVRSKHTRPFICVFHYAGCDKTFAAKNEWKRHVSSQHLYLEYYLCDYKQCAVAKPALSKHRFSSTPKLGAIFNRKDLYTQHARRMHQPDSRGKKPEQQWGRQLEAMQKRALQKRCELPREMFCPVSNCRQQFLGEKAWDDRMEHVAHHLERAAAGEEHPVSFGGVNDPTLTNWAESPGVDVVIRDAGGWRLNYPEKGAGKGHHHGSLHNTLEQDAEGDEF